MGDSSLKPESADEVKADDGAEEDRIYQTKVQQRYDKVHRREANNPIIAVRVGLRERRAGVTQGVPSCAAGLHAAARFLITGIALILVEDLASPAQHCNAPG